MLREIGVRDGFTCEVAVSVEDLDLPSVSRLLERAWHADYAGKVRPRFDTSFLRGLLASSGWIAVLIRTEAFEPVGFRLAFDRTLYCQGMAHRASYTALRAVSPEHRRRGLGTWLIEVHDDCVFGEGRADVNFMIAKEGHAGLPSLLKSVEHEPGFGIHCFHSGVVWWRRLDHAPLASLSAPPPVARLTFAGSVGALIPLPGAPAAPVPSRAPPSLDELAEEIRITYAAGFGPYGTLGRQYLSAESENSATYWYDFGAGDRCLLTFRIRTMMRDHRRLGLAAQLQTVHARGCRQESLRIALHHASTHLADRGCFAITMMDQGVVPYEILEALGYRAGPVRVALAVRGPRGNLIPFEGIEAPYSIDIV